MTLQKMLHRPGMKLRLFRRFLLGALLYGLPFGLALAFIARVGDNPWRTVAISVIIYGSLMSALALLFDLLKRRKTEHSVTPPAAHAP